MPEPASAPVSSIDLGASASIRRIEEKRLLLKRVVAITRAIQRMQEGFKAVLILGEATAGVPEQALRFFRALSENIRTQPTEKIRGYLDRLEALLKDEFETILTLSEIDPEAVEEPPDELDDNVFSEQTLGLLREFKRRAQTAVSLKVLLQERGVAVPATVIPVPAQEIRRRLVELDQKERKQRQKLREQINGMKSDVERLINSSAYTDQMKAVFGNVIAGLDKDIQTLETGYHLDDLELSFEAVEGDPCMGQALEEALMPSSEKTIAGGTAAESNGVAMSMREPASAQPKPKGFFQLILYWLNTPWGVSWRQIK